MGIAVLPVFRGRGIGSKLLDYILHACPCRGLLAETDDDAVAFYRKYGFETLAFMKNGEYKRYRCTYQNASRENKEHK